MRLAQILHLSSGKPLAPCAALSAVSYNRPLTDLGYAERERRWPVKHGHWPPLLGVHVSSMVACSPCNSSYAVVKTIVCHLFVVLLKHRFILLYVVKSERCTVHQKSLKRSPLGRFVFIWTWLLVGDGTGPTLGEWRTPNTSQDGNRREVKIRHGWWICLESLKIKHSRGLPPACELWAGLTLPTVGGQIGMVHNRHTHTKVYSTPTFSERDNYQRAVHKDCVGQMLRHSHRFCLTKLHKAYPRCYL